MNEGKIVGLTKDVGFQIGVRKSFSVSVSKVWHFLFSDEGLPIWLGKITSGSFELNKKFETVEEIEGAISVFKPNSHVRFSYKPKGWTNASTVQIRVIDSKGKTTVSFHQEKLLDSNQREQMKIYWEKVLKRFSDKFKPQPDETANSNKSSN